MLLLKSVKDQAGPGVSDVTEKGDQAGISDEKRYVYDPIDFSDHEEEEKQ